MRTVAASILIVCAGWLAAGDAPVPTAAPLTAEATVTGWIQALRTGDLAGLYRQLPEPQRTLAEAQWKSQVVGVVAQHEQQLDQVLAMLASPQAVDGVMAAIAPTLVQTDVTKLSTQITDVAGFIGAASTQPQAVGSGIDLTAVKDWLLDVAGWLPKSGLNNAVKAREFSTHLVRAFLATGIRGSHEIKQLTVADLLTRLGPGLAELKTGLAVYGLDANQLLASLTVTKSDGTAESAKLVIGYTAFGKMRSAPLTLVNKDGGWQFGEGKDSPLAGVMQLIVMAMMMNAFSPTPAGEPATPAAGGPL